MTRTTERARLAALALGDHEVDLRRLLRHRLHIWSHTGPRKTREDLFVTLCRSQHIDQIVLVDALTARGKPALGGISASGERFSIVLPIRTGGGYRYGVLPKDAPFTPEDFVRAVRETDSKIDWFTLFHEVAHTAWPQIASHFRSAGEEMLCNYFAGLCMLPSTVLRTFDREQLSITTLSRAAAHAKRSGYGVTFELLLHRMADVRHNFMQRESIICWFRPQNQVKSPASWMRPAADDWMMYRCGSSLGFKWQSPSSYIRVLTPLRVAMDRHLGATAGIVAEMSEWLDHSETNLWIQSRADETHSFAATLSYGASGPHLLLIAESPPIAVTASTFNSRR